MKEIKSDNYIKKEAQMGQLPGDPNLPGGVTNKMIDDQSSGPEESISNEKGESDVEVDWETFRDWYATGGEPLPDIYLKRISPVSAVNMIYTYNYDNNTNEISNINVISGKDYDKNASIYDRDVLDALIEYYGDQIKKDIFSAHANYDNIDIQMSEM